MICPAVLWLPAAGGADNPRLHLHCRIAMSQQPYVRALTCTYGKQHTLYE